jgi:hypothetical protein
VESSMVPLLGALGAYLCGVTTGSRGVLAFAAVGLLAYLASSRNSRQLLRLVPFVVVLVGALWLGPFSGLTDAYWQRLVSSEDSISHRALPSGEELFAALQEKPFGNGLGSASQVASFESISISGVTTGAEDRVVRLANELGFMIFPVLLTLLLLPLRLLVSGLSLRSEHSTCVLPVLGLLYALVSGNVFFDHVAASLWWTGMAIAAGGSTQRKRPPRFQTIAFGSAGAPCTSRNSILLPACSSTAAQSLSLAVLDRHCLQPQRLRGSLHLVFA